MVAGLSTGAYLISISPIISQIAWNDLGLRIAFLYFIAIPVGVLSKKVQRDKDTVEDLNRRLAKTLGNLRLAQDKLIEVEKFSALGRLTADIAHEIRNPLTTIGGFARRLNKKLEESSQEKMYVDIIVQEVGRLEKILIDTFIYGKSGQFKLSRGNLAVPVEEALSFYKKVFADQKIDVVKEFKPDFPEGKIDMDQVRQALECILSNAIDAMPNGGTLTVTCDHEEQDYADYLTIGILDTGSGITPEVHKYIFEPFYSTKKIGPGTGLGLTTVRKIMEEHRGFVRVENILGHGVKCTLYFPYQSKIEDEKLPCWEFLNCGIETDPARICFAFPYFGRICWATAGSFSEAGISGICARKIDSCQECSFFQMVKSGLPIYSGNPVN
jgi:signal transduction histidine kinase